MIILSCQPHHLKGLNGSRVEENKARMYSMYEAEYGIRMIRAEERLTAVAATKVRLQKH